LGSDWGRGDHCLYAEKAQAVYVEDFYGAVVDAKPDGKDKK
jgi:hypothetical protein